VRTSAEVADPRLLREAKALVEHGYNVVVLSLDREARNGGWENSDGIVTKKLALKSPVDDFRIVFYYPIFWVWVFFNILSMKPWIIHACNLDAGVIGYVCRKLGLCRKFVFDIFDGFALSFIPPNRKLLLSAVHSVENRLFYEADGGIIPSAARAKFYKRFNRKRTVTILNSPPDCIKYLNDSDGSHQGFTVVYAGNIGLRRGLLQLVEATRDLHVNLILAGRVYDPNVLFECCKHRHVEYVGILSYIDALDLENRADCLAIFYEPSSVIHILAEPNKMYEAMMLGKPVVSNVKEGVVNKCGINIRYGDIDGLRKAIRFLKENPCLAHEMGLNGRRLYEKYYNWDIQRSKLVALYKDLLGEIRRH